MVKFREQHDLVFSDYEFKFLTTTGIQNLVLKNMTFELRWVGGKYKSNSLAGIYNRFDKPGLPFDNKHKHRLKKW